MRDDPELAIGVVYDGDRFEERGSGGPRRPRNSMVWSGEQRRWRWMAKCRSQCVAGGAGREHKAGLVKIIGQNHPFLGVNNAVASMLEAPKQGHGRACTLLWSFVVERKPPTS